MNENKNKFNRKYNFDISSEIISQNNESIDYNHVKNITRSLSENQTFENNKIEIKQMLKELDCKKEELKVIIESSNPEEKKKIVIDSKTYSQNLKRKIKLNYKLFQLFSENFYKDEFNQSRKATYLIIALPSSVILLFSTLLPNHPLFGISLNIAAVASIASFMYFYNRDIREISLDTNSNLARQIRMIKNELVLYNALSKTILTEDEKKQNNYKF